MFKISASLSCANILRLEEAITELNKSEIAFIHYDVVDGKFNNTFVFGDLILEKVRPLTNLPIEVHLAVENPEPYLEPFIKAGANYIAVHREIMNDTSILRKIKELGAKPILAYRADTAPRNEDVELLKHSFGVLKLTVNPGFSGQSFQAQTLDHISELKLMIQNNNLDLEIQADGNINTKTTPKVIKAGASIVTGGTSGLFTKDKTIFENIDLLKESVECL